MRVNKSLSDPLIQSGRNEDERSAGTTDFIFQAIENAEGVPFQLIFGPRIGEGYYTNIGGGIYDLIGIRPEDLTEKAFLEMVEEIVPLSPNIPRDFEDSRCKFISGELKSYRAEVKVKLPSGETKWIRDASLPLIDEETGKVLGAFGILNDISETRRSQTTVRKAEKRAEELEGLKKAFLRNISHEIRTPLNAIVGFSALLGEPGNTPEQLKEFREIIMRSTDHLLALINDIVELSKAEASMVQVKISRVNINQTVTSIYEQLWPQAMEKELLFSFRNPLRDEDSFFMTDGYKLKQVLLHLVGNAVKFTPSGRVEFGYENEGEKFEFFVKDTGIGISPERQSDIFSKFYQADSGLSRNYEGNGLGLTIAKTYIDILGGKIWFTSEVGKGSEFRFTLVMKR